MGRDARQRIEQDIRSVSQPNSDCPNGNIDVVESGNKPLELTQSWPKCLVAISFLSAVLAFTVVYTHSVLLFGQD